jgi:hypothetical protein
MRLRGAMAAGILVLSSGVVQAMDEPLPRPCRTAAHASEPRLRLAWVDVAGDGAEAVFEDAARELADIFSDAHIAIDWRRAQPGEGIVESDVHVIVLESGTNLPRQVMGAARHSDHPPHSLRVFLRHIRETLGLDPRPDAFILPCDRAALGRAVGRVIAHEIIHVYAPEHGHETEGLMRPSLDAEFLRQERVHLATAAVKAVVDGIGGSFGDSVVLAPEQ